MLELEILKRKVAVLEREIGNKDKKKSLYWTILKRLNETGKSRSNKKWAHAMAEVIKEEIPDHLWTRKYY